MPPGPPQSPQIPPRQPGESDNAYRKRRSVALTGETPYQRRIRLGRAQGKTVTEARGQRPGEAQRRRERVLRQTGFTPWQIWRDRQVQWLVDNGFQPDTTGWSWNRLIRAAPKIRYMNEKVSAFNQITPWLLADAIEFEEENQIPSNWSWQRLNEHYADIYEFYEHNNPENARMHYFMDRIPEMPVQWWYYRLWERKRIRTYILRAGMTPRGNTAGSGTRR
jgi:hypothetical protein